jgi:hypothetical protein
MIQPASDGGIMKIGLGLMFATVLACGGGNLNTAMNGTWAGPATLTLSGESPQSFSGEVQVAVSGENATFSGFCLDGTGSVVAHGSGNSASWSGSFACPAVAFTGCSSVVLTFQSASATLNGSTMNAQGAGNAAGCTVSKGFTISIAGTQQ